jgi:putative PEP-CTERM system TPR-repeat lipoprotein
VQQAPENLEARKLLANVNLRLQRPEVAMQVLIPAQQSSSLDPQVDALLALANLQRGNQAAAVELLQRSVAAQPANEGLKLDLALAYVSAGRNQEAIDLLNTLPARPGSARREYLLIAAIAKVKSPQDAQAEVEKIVRANPKDAELLGVAASFYAQNRNFPRARVLLRDAVALDPKNAGSLARLARLELEAGDDAAARSALLALLTVDPASQAAHLALAQIDLRNQETKRAIEQLETARGADEKAVEPRLLLAAQYLRERRTKEADSVLKELATLAETNPAIAAVTGRLYVQAGRYDEALSLFRAAVRREPRNPSWLLEVARVQVARGDASGARDSLQKALEIEPDAVAVNGLMIALELKEGRSGQALARALRVRGAHSEDASAAMLEGDVHFATRDAASAAKAFADSYRLAPSSGAAIRTYQSRSLARLAASTALLTDWLQRHPQDRAARTIYAQALLEQGQNAAAIAQFEQVVAGGKPGAMALNNLAWLYQQAHDPRAEATAKRAFDQAPEVPAIADTYGWILVEAGRASVALPILERAASAAKATPEVHYHYAVALAKAGQPDEARASLRKLVAGPAFAEAGEARALLKQLGDGS